MQDAIGVKVIGPPSFSPAAIVQSVAALWSYTDLLITLSLHRIKVRYKQSVLGLAWAIVQPLALMLIYTIIFSVFTRVETRGIPYPVFVYCALLPWTFFSTALTNTATSLSSHNHLITKVYFPREILPLTYVVAALFDFLIAALIMAGLMVWYGIGVTIHVLYALPIMVVFNALALSLGLVLSAVQVRFRDIAIAMPLVLQIWMFASPVVYPLSSVPARFRTLYDLNPVVGLIESFRRVVLEGTPPDMLLLGQSALMTLVILPIAYLYFKHRESTMADII